MIAWLASPSPYSEAAAKDLGVHGALFPIEEPDLLDQIYGRLRDMEARGEIAEINREFVERVKANAERPPGVVGLSHTDEPRSWLFDPTITLSADITDHEGRLLGRRGQQINPLDHQAFLTKLVFIDGDNADQVAWARSVTDRWAQIILVAGAPLDLMREHKRPFFFDQGGQLVGRFGIQRVPATVAREGDRLRVSEVLPDTTVVVRETAAKK